MKNRIFIKSRERLTLEQYLPIASDTISLTHAASENRLWISQKVLFAFTNRKLYEAATAVYFYLGYLMTCDETFALSQNIPFGKILESCDALPEISYMKHQTTLMRALVDLEDAGLIKWNAKAHTFQILHITPYDPAERSDAFQ